MDILIQPNKLLTIRF